MGVKLHIREGGKFTARLGQRPSVTIVADVSGVSGNTTKMLVDAYQQPGMLRQGNVVPGLANFIVTGVDGDAVGPNKVRFVLTAEERPAFQLQINRKEETREGLIQIGGSLTTRSTQRDKDGVPLTITYTPDGGEPDTQGVSVDHSVPVVTRLIERVETNPDVSLADKFVGTVNRTPIWGRSERTLMCRAIEFRSRDGGATWDGRYEFLYRFDNWDVRINHEDEETGKPTVGITLGNGIKQTQVYRETEFKEIGVKFPR